MSADEFVAALPFRVKTLESTIQRLQDWRSKVDTERATQAEQLKTLDVRMDDLTTAVDSLRKTIVGFALTVAGSAVIFAFSVLVATGKV